MEYKKNKKAQSEIIITIIVILMVFSVIIIVWREVRDYEYANNQDQINLEYYSNPDTFCQHFNMTFYIDYSSSTFNGQNKCVLNINDTAIKRNIQRLNGRWYFINEEN